MTSHLTATVLHLHMGSHKVAVWCSG